MHSMAHLQRCMGMQIVQQPADFETILLAKGTSLRPQAQLDGIPLFCWLDCRTAHAIVPFSRQTSA